MSYVRGQGMIRGKRYRVTYTKGPRQKTLTAVLTFLSESEDGRHYYFDARPEFGTQVMPIEWVIAAEVVPFNTPIQIR